MYLGTYLGMGTMASTLGWEFAPWHGSVDGQARWEWERENAACLALAGGREEGQGAARDAEKPHLPHNVNTTHMQARTIQVLGTCPYLGT